MSVVDAAGSIVSILAFTLVTIAALWWRPRTLEHRSDRCSFCGYAIANGARGRCAECGSDLLKQQGRVQRRVRTRIACGLVAIISIILAGTAIPLLDRLLTMPQYVRWEVRGDIRQFPVRFVGANEGWVARGTRESSFDRRPKRIEFTMPGVTVIVQRSSDGWIRVPDGRAMSEKDIAEALTITDTTFVELVQSLLISEWKLQIRQTATEVATLRSTPWLFFDSRSESYPFENVIRCVWNLLIAGLALSLIARIRRRELAQGSEGA
jgi:predicted nucleic acid-binding Zn ribbon protein